MRITVTEEHIRKGRKRDCGTCPIAIAITEATGRPMKVGPWSAWEAKHPHPLTELPKEARNFVIAFDRGKPVHPFSFDLPLEESAAHPKVDESH